MVASVITKWNIIAENVEVGCIGQGTVGYFLRAQKDHFTMWNRGSLFCWLRAVIGLITLHLWCLSIMLKTTWLQRTPLCHSHYIWIKAQQMLLKFPVTPYFNAGGISRVFFCRGSSFHFPRYKDDYFSNYSSFFHQAFKGYLIFVSFLRLQQWRLWNIEKCLHLKIWLKH